MRPRAASKTELAKLYNVHYSTFIKWLNKIPDLEIEKRQRLLTPKQVEKVLFHLGEP